MGRGFLLGIVWGVLLALIAGTTLSLVYSNDKTEPEAVEPETEAPEAQAPSIGAVEAPAKGAIAEQSTEQQSTAQTDIPKTDTTEVSTTTPAAPEMAQSDAPPANGGGTTVEVPDVMIPDEGNNGGALADNADDSGAISAADAAVSPGTTSELPEAPKTGTLPETETHTEAMTAPEMQEGPEAGEGSLREMQGDAGAPDVKVAQLPKADTPDQLQSPQTDAALSEVEPAPVIPMDAPVDAPMDAEPETPEPKPEGQFDAARVPVPKMTNLAPNVKTNRLPTIGGTTGTVETAEVAQEEATPDPEMGALATYAMAFENPDAKPMFSIVLIDDPQTPLSDDVLSHLPFALSFAINAVRDDAHAVAARYRAAGFEVLMLTNLPFGANATDIEIAFGAYSRAIPEAIGVLDLGANGFLRGPSTATQIAGIMSDQGYGLITPSKGLNSAQKAAKREGVPAVLLFRELDDGGEKPSTIRRYLDRAAFRAAQEGSVIMLGHTRPDTIEALVTWALEDRAASVAIAPVSAVMLAQ